MIQQKISDRSRFWLWKCLFAGIGFHLLALGGIDLTLGEFVAVISIQIDPCILDRAILCKVCLYIHIGSFPDLSACEQETSLDQIRSIHVDRGYDVINILHELLQMVLVAFDQTLENQFEHIIQNDAVADDLSRMMLGRQDQPRLLGIRQRYLRPRICLV